MSVGDWIGLGIVALVIVGGLVLLNQITKPYGVKCSRICGVEFMMTKRKLTTRRKRETIHVNGSSPTVREGSKDHNKERGFDA